MDAGTAVQQLTTIAPVIVGRRPSPVALPVLVSPHVSQDLSKRPQTSLIATKDPSEYLPAGRDITITATGKTMSPAAPPSLASATPPSVSVTAAPPPASSVMSVTTPEGMVRFKRDWTGWVEVSLNVIGTVSFVIGSFMWVVGLPVPGCIIFAFACLCCGSACSIYSYKFAVADDFVSVFAFSQQAIGSFLFTTVSIMFIYPDYTTICLIGFFAASFLYLSGTALTHIVLRCWTGPMAPPVAIDMPHFIPTALLNTLGSVFFTLGSVFLFYPDLNLLGSWMYAIGSIVFFFASWGDATLWWKLGRLADRRVEFVTTKLL